MPPTAPFDKQPASQSIAEGGGDPAAERVLQPRGNSPLPSQDQDAAAVSEPRQLPPVRVFPAESIEERVTLVGERSWLWSISRWLGGGIERCFGMACLLVLLAVLASVPVLQFISLGYLLEVSGRISRSGRLRDGFFEVRTAARIGSLFAGTWLMLLPLRWVSDIWYSAYLVDADSGVTAAWRVGLMVLTVLIVLHILLAWYCGGRLRHFFWPLLAAPLLSLWLARRALAGSWPGGPLRAWFNRQWPRLANELTAVPQLHQWFPPAVLAEAIRRRVLYSRARDAVWEFVMQLRIPYYFWLGLRGFVGAVIWLCVPILLVIGSTQLGRGDFEGSADMGAMLGLAGSFLLALVVLYLPFLQAHFAAERRFAAVFEWTAVRRQFRRAPIAFWTALAITLLFALPLYLLKIAVVPREVVWLPSLVFVAFIFPARIITGWAVSRARRREQPRMFLSRWMARLAALPVAAVYALVVYFTQYTSWYGSWSLFEQHAFLTPVPFLGL